MSVYVDAAIWPYRRMVMCHLVADTEAELHAMAARIGVARRWFQNTKYPHYDVCKTKRALAVQYGAIEIDRRQFIALVNQLRSPNNPPDNMSSKLPHLTDEGVPRQYLEAAPNPTFSEMTRASIRFVRYREKVLCAFCGKPKRRHWTGVVRFKVANLFGATSKSKLSKRWFPAWQPVCVDHAIQPDENLFVRQYRRRHNE